MDFTSDLISADWIRLSWLIYGVLTIGAVIKAPWRRMLEWDSTNVYFGTTVVLLVLWFLKAGVEPGQGFHLLGATALTLMFGWPFALFAVTVLVAVTTLNGHGSWDTFGLNVLMMGAIPIAVTHNLLRLCQRFLPHHFFIYIFVNAFFAAALSIVLIGNVAADLLLQSGAYTAAQLQHNYLPFLWLIALPEAAINGIIMTGVVVYKPNWVATFDDRTYLNR